MAETITVVITDPKHIRQLGIWFGMVQCLEVLKTTPEFARLPGFYLAQTIVEREANEARALGVGANLRAVAKAGVDVGATKEISLQFGVDGATFSLGVQMMDLADMAGEPAARGEQP